MKNIKRILSFLITLVMLPPMIGHQNFVYAEESQTPEQIYEQIISELAAGINADGTVSDYSQISKTVDGQQYTLNLEWSNIRNASVIEENGSYATGGEYWLCNDGTVSYPEWFEGNITLKADVSAYADNFNISLTDIVINLSAKNNMPSPTEMVSSFCINSATDTEQFGAVRYNTYENCTTLNKNGSMGIILPCTSKADQYITIKLDGTYSGNGVLFMADAQSGNIGTNGIGVPLVSGSVDRSDRPELNFCDGTSQYENGYIYSTYQIPAYYIKGDNDSGYYVAVRIYSTGARNNYALTHLSEQTDESRGIHAVYISENKAFDPNEFNEVIITNKASEPINGESTKYDTLMSRTQNALSVFMKRQVYNQSNISALNGMMTRTYSDNWTRTLNNCDLNTYYNLNQALAQNLTTLNGLEVMAKAYKNSDTLGVNDKKQECFDRVVTGIDFLCRAQGSNGGWYSDNGWIGGPERKPAYGNNLTGFGLKSAAQSVIELFDDISTYQWGEMIDTDCDNINDTQRSVAWARAFSDGRDFLLENTYGYGHAPNQDMADITAALRFEAVLEKMTDEGVIGAGYAWSERKTEAQKYLDIAFGLALNKACYSYWVSPKGLILENFGSIQGGYSGDYGTNAIVSLGQLLQTAKNIGVEKVDTYQQILDNAYESIAPYYFIGKNSSGYETLYAEGMVSERNNYYPGTERYPLDFYSLDNPVCAKIFAYNIAHDHEKVAIDAHFEDNAVTAIDLILNWDKVQSVINTDYVFPMEDDTLNQYAIADEMAKNVVVKNGSDKLYVSMNWRNPLHSQRVYVEYDENGNVSRYAAGNINNKARVHYTRKSYDVYGTVGMETLESNLDTSSWKNFDEYQYVRGIMDLKYGDYYIIMNSTGLAGDTAISRYKVSDFKDRLSIPDGVYVNLMTMQNKEPVYYVLGNVQYTPKSGVKYITDSEISGAETVVLCNENKLMSIDDAPSVPTPTPIPTPTATPYVQTKTIVPKDAEISTWGTYTMYDKNKKTQVYASSNANNQIAYLGTYDASQIDSIDICASIAQAPEGNTNYGKCGVKIGYMPYDENTEVNADYISANSTDIRSASKLAASVIAENTVSDSIMTALGISNQGSMQGANYIVTRRLVCADTADYIKKYDSSSVVNVNTEKSVPLKTIDGKVELFMYATAQSGRVSVDYVKLNFDNKINLNKVKTRVYDQNNNDVTSAYIDKIKLNQDNDISTSVNLGTKKFIVYDFGEKGVDITKLALYNDRQTIQGNDFVMVYGDCSNGDFTGEWECTERYNVLRTNNSVQNSVPIMENGWGGGYYAVGPVGKYRYVAVYNWSNSFGGAEIELYSSQLQETDKGIIDVYGTNGIIQSVTADIKTEAAILYAVDFNEDNTLNSVKQCIITDGRNDNMDINMENVNSLYLWNINQKAFSTVYKLK